MKRKVKILNEDINPEQTINPKEDLSQEEIEQFGLHLVISPDKIDQMSNKYDDFTQSLINVIRELAEDGETEITDENIDEIAQKIKDKLGISIDKEDVVQALELLNKLSQDEFEPEESDELKGFEEKEDIHPDEEPFSSEELHGGMNIESKNLDDSKLIDNIAKEMNDLNL